MANPSGSAAEAAYERAVAAFSAQSYDVARRWVLEALAQNPEHAGARALLGRLDSVRRPPNPAARTAAPRPSPFGSSLPAPASEAVSTDPTVLISNASRSSAPEAIEPTVMVRRPDPQRPPAPDPFAPVRSPMRDTAPTSEPTVIRRAPEPPAPAPPSPPPRARGAGTGGGFLQRWRDLFGGGRPAGRPPAPKPAPKPARTGGFSPQMRGGALVVGAVVAAALLLALGIAAVRWMWPAGQKLTLTRPTGGTIVGPGIECGSKGNDCSTDRPTGEVVELEAKPDPNFLFSGFTGDCAPVGRISMTGPRKCGATFEAAPAAVAAVTFPLMIDKPVGGTIAGEPNILCGTLDNICTANIPSGTPVALHFQADTNYTFQAFTKDCAPNGEMVMNAAKSCGAIFMQTPGATVVNKGPEEPVVRRDRPKKAPEESTGAKSATPADTGVKPALPPPPPPPGPTTGQQSTTLTTGPPPDQGPTKAPITEEQHAKDEIASVVTNYCQALQTLKPDSMRGLFSQLDERRLRDQFRQYKSLKCTITEKPEFQRLDINPAGSGGAQVKVGVKQTLQAQSGGAPEVKELILTIVLSRTNRQSAWLIDRLVAEDKPK